MEGKHVRALLAAAVTEVRPAPALVPAMNSQLSVSLRFVFFAIDVKEGWTILSRTTLIDEKLSPRVLMNGTKVTQNLLEETEGEEEEGPWGTARPHSALL